MLKFAIALLVASASARISKAPEKNEPFETPRRLAFTGADKASFCDNNFESQYTSACKAAVFGDCTDADVQPYIATNGFVIKVGAGRGIFTEIQLSVPIFWPDFAEAYIEFEIVDSIYPTSIAIALMNFRHDWAEDVSMKIMDGSIAHNKPASSEIWLINGGNGCDEAHFGPSQDLYYKMEAKRDSVEANIGDKYTQAQVEWLAKEPKALAGDIQSLVAQERQPDSSYLCPAGGSCFTASTPGADFYWTTTDISSKMRKASGASTPTESLGATTCAGASGLDTMYMNYNADTYYGGTFLPKEGDLSAFFDKEAQGWWSMWLKDEIKRDVGYFDSLSIVFDGCANAACGAGGEPLEEPISVGMQFKHQLVKYAEHGTVYSHVDKLDAQGNLIGKQPGSKEPLFEEYDTRFIYYYVDADVEEPTDQFDTFIGTTCYPDKFVTYVITLVEPPPPPVEAAVLGSDPYTMVDLSWEAVDGARTLLYTKGPLDPDFVLFNVNADEPFEAGIDKAAMINLEPCTTYQSYVVAIVDTDIEGKLVPLTSLRSNEVEITTGCHKIPLGAVCEVSEADDTCDTNVPASVGQTAAVYLSCNDCARRKVDARGHKNKRGLLFAPIPTTTTTTTTTLPVVCLCGAAP